MDLDQMTRDWKAKLAAVDSSQYSLSWDLLLIGVVTLIVGVVGYGSWRRRVNLPPGPRNWPVVRALFKMEPQFNKVLHKFAAKYGDVAFFRVGVQRVAVVSSAEVAEEHLRQKDTEFGDRAAAMNRSASKYTGLNGAVFAFTDTDAELKLHRKLSNTEFFTIGKIRSYEKLRTQDVTVIVEKLRHAIGQSDYVSNVNGSSQKLEMGIRVIGEAHIRNIVFVQCIGKRLDSLPPDNEHREFPELLEGLLELLMCVNLAGSSI